MTTSSFRLAGNHPRAVSIARRTPRWFKGRVYLPLAPCWPLVRCKDQEKFTRLYHEKVLSRLDPRVVVEALGPRAVLLCYEAPGAFCHRRIVARWLWRETGLFIREYRLRGGAQ